MTNRVTERCNTCGKEITTNNINKHANACTGVRVKKVRGVDYDPNVGFKNGTRTGWNKGLTKVTDARVAKNAENISLAKREAPLRGCAAWTTEQRRESAKVHGCGGYRPNAGRSKKFKVSDSYGREVTLQSTYELACSEILTALGIMWVRPKALRYDGRKYFADFYLPDFNIWLDPKNDYKAKMDEEKVNKVIEQNGVTLHVLLHHQLTEDYIMALIQANTPQSQSTK